MSDPETEAYIAELERKVEMYRKTNTRLNRRCQANESYVLRAETRRIWVRIGHMFYGAFKAQEADQTRGNGPAKED